jgi:Zn-dependent M28 family amino/carboxypeptidase
LQAVLRAAHAEGAREHFTLYPHQIGDDHVPFLEAGMPAVDIIDFHYGTKPGRNDLWHTPADTMEQISAESLGIVGRVTMRVVNDLLSGLGGSGR